MFGKTQILALLMLAAACAQPAPPAETASEPVTPPMDPVQAKVTQAMAGGPAALTAAATIMDWPGADGQMTELRAGTNGWMCLPSAAAGAPGDNAMCLDQAWQGWVQAWSTRGPVPAFKGVGFGYMLLGDRGASNVDPFATGPTPDNQWVQEGPHLMLIASDSKTWDALPTDPKSGGPYVMWKGTPYVHVMVPLK